MKKFKPKKNLLREFIFNNDMKQASGQTIKSLLRSIVEPVVQDNSDGVVLMRLFDTNGLDGLLKRLDYSKAGVYFYSDMGEDVVNVAQNDIWETTEFAIVLAPRYCAALVWDYGASDIDGYSNINFYLNTKRIHDILKEVLDNSKIDFMPDVEPYSLERRDNGLMCEALHKVVDCLNDAVLENHITSETVEAPKISETIVNENPVLESEMRKIIHEIRNNLSVIDLHSKIIEKRASKVDGDTAEKILGAKAIIEKSTKVINVLLDDLRNSCQLRLETLDTKEIVEMALELVLPKLKEKKITLENNVDSYEIWAEETKLLGVLMNILNNAVYALSNKGSIKISTEKNSDRTVSIFVENDGAPIPKNIQREIFEEGFTTKIQDGGSGLGLRIAKTSMLAMQGDLNLVESDENSTTFELRLRLS